MLWFAKIILCYDFSLTDNLTRNYNVALSERTFSSIAQKTANIPVRKKVSDYFIENLS